jgi:hypothetical protein
VDVDVDGGKWQVASGKWQVASGKWQVASGKWQVGIGVRAECSSDFPRAAYILSVGSVSVGSTMMP